MVGLSTRIQNMSKLTFWSTVFWTLTILIFVSTIVRNLSCRLFLEFCFWVLTIIDISIRQLHINNVMRRKGSLCSLHLYAIITVQEHFDFLRMLILINAQ